MDQSDNAKIIKWLGWKRVKGFRHVWRLPDGSHRGLDPDFITLDADAITLLPVLLERGYVPALFVAHSSPDKWQ